MESTERDNNTRQGNEETSGSTKAKNQDIDVGSIFECHICLDVVGDPVVTLCGHLFCWPCLYRWLANNNNCPVCKAGVTRENVIPVYVRGSDNVDPRTKAANTDIPSRPAGQRPEPQPAQRFPGVQQTNQFGNLTFTTGFGFFPSLFGLQFQNFNTPIPPAQPGAPPSQEEIQQAFLSRVLLMIGCFLILCLLLF